MRTIPLGECVVSGLSLILDPVPSSVPAVRRWVRDLLALRPDYPMDAVLLCLSELATNALLHARTAMTVNMYDDGRTLRVEVVDSGDASLRRSAYLEDGDAESGRGLQLVGVLSTAHGVEPNSDGAGVTAWFEVTADEFAQKRDDVTA